MSFCEVNKAIEDHGYTRLHSIFYKTKSGLYGFLAGNVFFFEFSIWFNIVNGQNIKLSTDINFYFQESEKVDFFSWLEMKKLFKTGLQHVYYIWLWIWFSNSMTVDQK